MTSVGKMLKGLFSSGPHDSAVVRAYGKLPMSPEYRRLECDRGVAASFSRWIDTGWGQARTRDQHSKMMPARFCGLFPGQKEHVTASFWDSRDSGGREFPFTFFLTVLRNSLGPDGPSRFAQVLGLWDAIEAMRGELAELARGKRFDAIYRDRHILLAKETVDEDRRALIRQVEAIPLGDFAEALAQRVGTSDLQNWLEMLSQSLPRWKDQMRDTGLAIRCPISPRWSPAAQVIAWIQWLETNLDGRAWPDTIIMPQLGRAEAGETDDSPEAVLLFRDLTAEDFQLLTNWASAYEYADSVVARSSDSADNKSQSQFPAKLLDSGTSLWDWARCRV